MTKMPFATSVAWLADPGVGRRDKTRGQSSTTFGQCTTGSAWCVTNVTTTHQPHQTPSTAMACRTAKPPEREVPMSQPHPDNCQLETYGLNLSLSGIWIEESREFAFPWAALLGTPPCPLAQPWRRTRWRRCHLPPHNVPSPVFPHIWTRWPPANQEPHGTSASSVGLYKLNIES